MARHGKHGSGGSPRSLLLGAALSLAIFGGLVGLLSLATGRSPRGDGSERMAYKSAEDVTLAARVYRPRGWQPGDRRPCVIWFFGGGWETGEPGQFRKQAEWMTGLGLVAITPDYRVRSRHGDGATPLHAVQDARSAMRWARANADSLGIDPDRIAAGGGSSGGHLAAACAILQGPDDPSDDTRVSPRPDALLLLNPVLDLDIPAVRQRIHGERFQALLDLSPAHQVHQMPEPLPPALILHGTADRIVPISTAEAFAETVASRDPGAGQNVITLVPYPGRPHDFYHHGLGGDRDFRDTMRRAEAFLRDLGWLAPPSPRP